MLTFDSDQCKSNPPVPELFVLGGADRRFSLNVGAKTVESYECGRLLHITDIHRKMFHN